MLAAFSLFWFSGFRIRRICEPEVLQMFAGHSIWNQARIAWRDPLLRRQIFTGCVLNLMLVMLLPINLLMAKLGGNLPDFQIQLLGSVQMISAMAGSWILKKAIPVFGPRKIMASVCPLIWFIPSYWLLVPPHFSVYAALLPFVMAGLLTNVINSTLSIYFTFTIPNRRQIGGTFWIFILTGGMVGLLGMFLNLGILSGIQYFRPMDPFHHFQSGFLVIGILFSGSILFPLALPDTCHSRKLDKNNQNAVLKP